MRLSLPRDDRFIDRLVELLSERNLAGTLLALAMTRHEVLEKCLPVLWRRLDDIEALDVIYVGVRSELAGQASSIEVGFVHFSPIRPHSLIHRQEYREDPSKIVQHPRFRRYADFVQCLHWDRSERIALLPRIFSALDALPSADEFALFRNLHTIFWRDPREECVDFGRFLVCTSPRLANLVIDCPPGGDLVGFQEGASRLVREAASSSLSTIRITRSPERAERLPGIPGHAQDFLALESATSFTSVPSLPNAMRIISEGAGRSTIRTLEVGVPLPRDVISALGEMEYLENLDLTVANSVADKPFSFLDPEPHDRMVDNVLPCPDLFPKLRTLAVSFLSPNASAVTFLQSLADLAAASTLEEFIVRVPEDPQGFTPASDPEDEWLQRSQYHLGAVIQLMFFTIMARPSESLRSFAFRGISALGKGVYLPPLRLLGPLFDKHSWPSLTSMHVIHCALHVDDSFLKSLGKACPGLKDLRLCDRQTARRSPRTIMATVVGIWVLTHYAKGLETVWLAVNDQKFWNVYALGQWTFGFQPRQLRCWNPLASEISEADVPRAIKGLPKLFPKLEEVTAWSVPLTSQNLDGSWSIDEDTAGLEEETRLLASRWQAVHDGITKAEDQGSIIQRSLRSVRKMLR